MKQTKKAIKPKAVKAAPKTENSFLTHAINIIKQIDPDLFTIEFDLKKKQISEPVNGVIISQDTGEIEMSIKTIHKEESKRGA